MMIHVGRYAAMRRKLPALVAREKLARGSTIRHVSTGQGIASAYHHTRCRYQTGHRKHAWKS
eukprot:1511163-Rhodomonas_salina.4